MRFALLVPSALLLLAVVALPPAPAPAQSTDQGILRVVVAGLRSGDGQVGCTLWTHGDGFPTRHARADRAFWVPIRGRRASCVFVRVTPGTYAVAVIHDENGNSRLDTGAFGQPQEGWGVSNNVGPRAFGPPRFGPASFPFEGEELRMRLRLRY
jgi:uncharacterized protein (DUF2141 family)